MSVNRQEIDLIIRAQLQGQSSFTGVSKAIAGLSKDIDAQVASAKRGETSIDELKASVIALQQAQESLKDQAGLIGQFDKTTAAVAMVETKVQEASAAYTEYRAKIGDLDKATDKQIVKLDRLGDAVKRAEAKYASQIAQQEQLKKALLDTGIALDKESDSENKLRRSAAELGISINKVQTAIRSYADDLRAAKEAERKLVAGDTLRKLATDAVAATKGYSTLNREIRSTPASGNLKAVVEDILDPANRVRATLAQVSEQTNKIETDFKRGAIAADKVSEAVRTLRNIQSRLVSQSGLVEDYAAQTARLREARAEYSRTRTAVLELAEAVRISKDRNAELEGKLKTAQVAYANSRTAMAAQVQSLRALRTELQQAGIKTNDLAGAQQRIVQTATRATAALNGLKNTTREVGQATRTGFDFGRFNDSGRTTLSLTQRIKGEFLALGSAYLGVFGIINNGTKVIDALNKRQQIQNSLSIAVGNDQRAIAEEYAYAAGQAERLGVEFTSLASGYAKFLAGGIQVGRTREELRFIFESFSEVGRVANLTEDDLNGIFKALEQIVSKGKVQSEELRGQLGDRLFGAFGVAQNALQEKFGSNLDKALKDGKVLASDLVEIAEEYRNIVADQLPAATKSLAAEQARLNTEFFNFKLLIADSGFAEAYKELVEDLITFFRSSDGKEFATNLATAFKVLAGLAVFLVNNINAISDALIFLGLLFVSRSFIAGIVGIGKMVEAAKAGSVAMKGLAANASIAQRVLTGLLTLLSRLNLVLLALSIGAILYNSIPQVKAFVDNTVQGFTSIIKKMQEAAREGRSLVGILAAGAAEAFNLIEKSYRKAADGRVQASVLAAQAARKREIETQLKDGNKPLVVGNFRTKVPLTDLDQTKLKAELRVINETEARRKAAQAPKAPAKAAATPAATTTPKPTVTDVPNPADAEKAAEAARVAAEKRARIEQALADELTRIEERIEKKEASTLAEREAAIENSYSILLRKIRAFYGQSSEMETRLNSAKEALITQEREKSTEERLKLTEQVVSKIETIEATAGRKEKLSLDQRLAAITTGYADAYRDIEVLRKRLSDDGASTEEATAAKARLDLAVQELQTAERRAFFQDELQRREKELNDLLSERQAKLETIETLKDTGLLTDLQARERAAEVIATLQSGIQAITDESLRWAEANRLALDPAQVARFVAEMTKARESAKGLTVELISARQLSENIANGASGAFNTAATAIGDAAAGTRSWGDALDEVRNGFLRFAADFLREIASMIAKQAILNALQASGGSGGGGFISGIAGAINGLFSGGGGAVASGAGAALGLGQSFVIHSGGVVNGTLNRKRNNVDPSMFVGAPKFHDGGVPGLAKDEYAAILQRNEEVLSADNPRNILNGGGKGEMSAPMQQAVNIVNTLNADDLANAVFGTAGFNKAIVNVIRSERSAVKTIVG